MITEPVRHSLVNRLCLVFVTDYCCPFGPERTLGVFVDVPFPIFHACGQKPPVLIDFTLSQRILYTDLSTPDGHPQRVLRRT
jgi:hypothetical protein